MVIGDRLKELQLWWGKWHGTVKRTRLTHRASGSPINLLFILAAQKDEQVKRRSALFCFVGSPFPQGVLRFSLFICYFYVREFPSHSCNDRRVFGLSRTSRERISRVGSVRDGVFSGAFLDEVRFRELISSCSIQFGHSRLLRSIRRDRPRHRATGVNRSEITRAGPACASPISLYPSPFPDWRFGSSEYCGRSLFHSHNRNTVKLPARTSGRSCSAICLCRSPEHSSSGLYRR
jgi:hypothetical protein